ncbi:hypothetical protein BDSB_23280 [Burkholderia dolosa PC543]|nr:hypothetical protein BDSB_23280 [Burkholderia dolosa PC543]
MSAIARRRRHSVAKSSSAGCCVVPNSNDRPCGTPCARIKA